MLLKVKKVCDLISLAGRKKFEFERVEQCLKQEIIRLVLIYGD